MTPGGDGILSGEDHPMYDSARFGELNPFYNKKHSNVSKEKMSKAHTGLVVALNIKTNQYVKVSKVEFDNNDLLMGTTKGVNITNEHKKNISKATLGKPKLRVNCKYCNMSIDSSNLKRHQNGKNCKRKE